MLGVGKSDGNSLVHCCFVVTPSLNAVQVTTITWYNYPLHCWNHQIAPSRRWKGLIANHDHMWDFVITFWHFITEVNRTWRMFGLSLTSNSAINFFTHLKVHPDFEPVFMHFGSLILLEPQVLQDTYMCTCNYIVLKSSVKPYLTLYLKVR